MRQGACMEVVMAGGSQKRKDGDSFLQKLKNLWERMDSKVRIGILIGLVVVIAICIILPFALREKEDDGNAVTPTTIPTPEPTLSVQPSETPAPTQETHENDIKSNLTGEWISNKFEGKRPYAIMLNNLKAASPQSGIGEAGILYEALVEGGITRFMGLYDNLDENSISADRIGSVRSARHYYVSFADEYDAIFIHHGKTSYATKKKAALNIDAMDGTEGIGNTAFHQINTIPSPHNTFTRVSEILAGIEKSGFRTEHEEGYESHFQFYEEDTELSSDTLVARLDLGYSGYISPYFIYDKELQLYQRYQFDEKHVDYNTQEILSFKNIIVQYVREWDIDKNGYQTMEIENAEGDGYYITNGKAVPIRWKKNESNRYMRYFNMDGTELKINVGKTFISVFPTHRLDKVVFTK